MAKKSKKPAKALKKAGTKRSKASRAGKKLIKTARAQKPAKRLPKRPRAKTVKTPDEIKTLRAQFAESLSAGAAGCCYFKDSSGGPDIPVPATQQECKDQGGVWSPGNCF